MLFTLIKNHITDVILSGVKALLNGVEESRKRHKVLLARFFDSARRKHSVNPE